MKVDLSGVLRYLLHFGDLQDGETFVYRNELYLRAGDSGVELEHGISSTFESGTVVHKVNMQVIHYEGETNDTYSG